MKEYTFAYGRGSRTFSLDEKRVVAEIVMPALPPLADVEASVLEALANPVGCEPLGDRVRSGDTATFICNDPTRVANSDEFMPVLADEMNRLGVPDANMQIVFALGTHRPMTEDEMREAVGEEIASRLKMYNSDASVPSDFEYFGATSRFTPVLINRRICHSDHVILTGSVVYHFFSGYGGGRKAVLPGCAAMESIRHNHSFMRDPASGLGRTEGNPVYEDQMEAVAMWAKGRSVFLFNAVLDARHRFLKMFAGDWAAAHKEACAFVDSAYGVPIDQKADIVVASCGGWPKDINVYQMQKTMDNAVLAVREGGCVVLLAECEEGSGSAVLEQTCRRLKSPEAIEADLSGHFVIGAHKAYAITRLMKKAHFILVTSLDRSLAHDLFFTAAVSSVDEALRIAEGIVGSDSTVALMPAGGLTVPMYRAPVPESV